MPPCQEGLCILSPIQANQQIELDDIIKTLTKIKGTNVKKVMQKKVETSGSCEGIYWNEYSKIQNWSKMETSDCVLAKELLQLGLLYQEYLYIDSICEEDGLRILCC